MEREKRFHLSKSEALGAVVSGTVMGIGAGSSMFLGLDPIIAAEIAVAGGSLALFGAGRVIIREHDEWWQEVSRHTPN